MLPAGFSYVATHYSLLEARNQAKEIAVSFKCEVAIDRESDDFVVIGVPQDRWCEVLKEICVIQRDEPDDEFYRPHPMDRLNAMLAEGEISKEEYEEYEEEWREEASKPDPRWSETENMRMDEQP